MKLGTKLILAFILTVGITKSVFAQNPDNMIPDPGNSLGLWLLLILITVPAFVFIGVLYLRFKDQFTENNEWKGLKTEEHFSDYLKNLSKNQIRKLINYKNDNKLKDINSKTLKTIAFLFFSQCLFAQNPSNPKENFFSQPGIIITIIIVMIPILLAVIFALIKANNVLKTYINKEKKDEARNFAAHIAALDSEELEENLLKRESALDYNLSNSELSGTVQAQDKIGILNNIREKHETHFVSLKKKAVQKPSLEPNIAKLIIWYFGCATFWLVLGTGIGEYLGIKFVAPDIDHTSWLSFGRLRPVHTNIVFWGWASLGMIGLGYYVVPIVSNAKIYSIKWGWIALVLTNLMVILGTICLMSGINNGGGEFREYIWPVMAFFAAALILTLANFIMTVANRTTKEIYISNWYIVSSIIFTIIVALTAYLPFWQDGVSETIVQGYFMHSGVGMWFTLYTLGLLYYFIPQQINKPIYAYSLGILAFWTQIIFYTIIGTHHFIFAPIPWWLQTVAIVGSAGMIIPVVAGTINFSMTFRGNWNKVTSSYTLPFFLLAVIYYFLVSMQGTAEAFKFTNLLWHFTDFTVAHAHLGFYGIITFTLWGGIYVVVPRLTGKEPPQHLVGVHFWLAFIGLLFYSVPLSIGATLRGLMWMEGKPFIDSVVLMFDFWVWRAIGGSLMFISHLIFAYNFYRMTAKEVAELDVKEEAFKILEQSNN
ncbi:cbb3-type cytochrome c oxidase subunit I [Flavobacterium sp. GT3R68]|uniref:cbb3-type cytochrome c oxidase subunit I n=1 Tax=Flavobacterium sp. GT3R68 TaxID=2594437 RepID=UPI002104146E|nr:cbb3-type cytochrome c oxidase subunit I [Flavobacterium sp. GT3R68]